MSACNSGKNWTETKLENTLVAYEEFLANNSETEYKDSVLLLIRELEWISAKAENTIAALDSFKLKYPENMEYKDSITSLKHSFAWKKAYDENTLNGFQEFMKDYPESPNRFEAARKIESLRWQQTKQTNKKHDYIEFLADVKAKNYFDSLNFKFELKDFVGYAISFNFSEKAKEGDVYIEMIFNFKPDGTLTGVFDGDQEAENYSASWSGEFKGEFDSNKIKKLKKRITDFSDVTDFKPEPWEKEDLQYSKTKQALYSSERTYKLLEIARIKK